MLNQVMGFPKGKLFSSQAPRIYYFGAGNSGRISIDLGTTPKSVKTDQGWTQPPVGFVGQANVSADLFYDPETGKSFLKVSKSEFKTEVGQITLPSGKKITVAPQP